MNIVVMRNSSFLRRFGFYDECAFITAPKFESRVLVWLFWRSKLVVALFI
jgi:hypothetical protein